MCACEPKIENKERVKLNDNDTRKYVSETCEKKNYSLEVQRTECSGTLARHSASSQIRMFCLVTSIETQKNARKQFI